MKRNSLYLLLRPVMYYYSLWLAYMQVVKWRLQRHLSGLLATAADLTLHYFIKRRYIESAKFYTEGAGIE
jgi:gamma-glutamylcysteine synthetase